jgi:hypothetical protein
VDVADVVTVAAMDVEARQKEAARRSVDRNTSELLKFCT